MLQTYHNSSDIQIIDMSTITENNMSSVTENDINKFPDPPDPKIQIIKQENSQTKIGRFKKTNEVKISDSTGLRKS